MRPLSVATLNLHNRNDRWGERRHLVVSEVMDAAPDLLGLQELNRPLGQGRWLKRQINTRLTGSSNKPYQLIQESRHHFARRYFEQIGVLTKFPVISRDAINLGQDGRVALRANVLLPSGQTLDFVCVHLHHVAQDREARLEQAMQLVGWLQQVGSAPLQVIVGDFNETPQGPAIQHMKQAYRSAFAAVRGHDPLATFPTALVDRPDAWAGCLDYIFVSPAIQILSARLFSKRHAPTDSTLFPSDHVGLIATLDTTPQRPPGTRRV